MNPILLFTGIVLLALGYLIGVKKQNWLLSGFNQRRVRDQEKLSRLVGTYNFVMGVLFLIGSIFRHSGTPILLPVLVIGYMILLGYVNTRMVE